MKMHSYKSLTNPGGKPKTLEQIQNTIRDAKKIVNALLNSDSGGTIHFGGSDIGAAAEGVPLTTADREAIKSQIEALEFFPDIVGGPPSVTFIELQPGGCLGPDRYRFDVSVRGGTFPLYTIRGVTEEAYTMRGGDAHLMDPSAFWRRQLAVYDYQYEHFR